MMVAMEGPAFAQLDEPRLPQRVKRPPCCHWRALGGLRTRAGSVSDLAVVLAVMANAHVEQDDARCCRLTNPRLVR